MSAPDPALEAEAIAAWKTGDRGAGDRLLRMHAGLIHAAVLPYQSPRSELDDLLQTGRVAMLEAAFDHDPARSKFSTWAFLRIGGAAWRYRRAGRYIVSDGTRAKDAHRHAISLDVPIDEGLSTLGNLLAAPTLDPMATVDAEALIATLPRRERDVLRRHFTGEGETLQAIGTSTGLSRERIRQIKQDGIDRLRLRVAA